MSSATPDRLRPAAVCDVDHPLATSGRRPRVAMFVLNPCHNDARVRKEAASLGLAGYDVRIFALGNRQWPEELIDEEHFSIQRLEVVSVYQRWIAHLSTGYRWLLFRGTNMRVPEADDLTLQPRRPPLALALLLAPLAAIVWPIRALSRLFADWRRTRAERRTSQIATGDVDETAPRSGLRRWAYSSLRFGRLVTRRVRAALRRLIRRIRRPVRKLARRVRRLARRGRLAMRRLTRRLVRRSYLTMHKLLRRMLIRLHRPSVFLQYWHRAAEVAAEWQPDIVHGHDLNALPAASRVAQATGARLVYDSHELWRRRNRGGQVRPLARIVDAYQERRLIKQTDLVITVSDSISRWLQDTYGLPAAPMVLRNLPTRIEPRDGPSLRELAGLGDQRILLYTGRITTGRGIEDAIAALPLLPDDLSLVMLGYGDDEFLISIWERVAAHGVSDRVHHVAAVAPNEVAAVAAQATMALIAIQPLCLSYLYALPNKLFEAIQAGVPVIASDLPDMSALVRRYECGELFRANDAEAFHSAAMKVLSDPRPYSAAAERAGAELHWDVESSLLVDAYRTLVAPEVRDTAGTS